MTTFTFSAEQLRSAPPEVRRWLEAEILSELGQSAGEGSAEPVPALAACAPDLLEQILALIGRHGPAGRVLTAFGGDTVVREPSGLRAVAIADLARRAGVLDREQLVECFDAIDQAFRRLHGGAGASLFAFDSMGHVYVHPETHRSLAQILAEATREHQPLDTPLTRAAGLMEGMPVPHLGPSEPLPQSRPAAFTSSFGA